MNWLIGTGVHVLAERGASLGVELQRGVDSIEIDRFSERDIPHARSPPLLGPRPKEQSEAPWHSHESSGRGVALVGRINRAAAAPRPSHLRVTSCSGAN